MKIHEYQAKALFRKFDIPVPQGGVARTAQEAAAQFKQHGTNGAMVKTQILAGGRGKAGGIKKASTVAEAETLTQGFIGSTLKTYQGGGKGEIVKAVLVEERRAFTKEFYMAITIGRSEGLPVLIFSEAGGMDIEEVAAKSPEKVLKVAFDPETQIKAAHFAAALKLTAEVEPLRAQFCAIAEKLAKLFVELDAALVEINPLVLMAEGGLLALDAKIAFDDNALFRHAELETMRDPDEDDPKEQRAKKFGLNYISLEGNVGCLVNGAGLAMTTMDAIKGAGGNPANFLDVGGGATQEAVAEGFSIMLEDPDVKAIMVNIFGGIMKCDIIAQALVDASRKIGVKIPLVVRLEGTRVEEGREILKNSGLKFHVETSIADAAQTAVRLAKAS
ncbi:MAG: ADP-forming succinate--CoA ligase subunit beta [Candidatus Omnitrophica bacterium]|jgi:succinyl-CoA synthetase beta subunit|nr:ADP-forming succinate--CoA ligase subunit beta [Candidatus Omnitrophota bacterium]